MRYKKNVIILTAILMIFTVLFYTKKVNAENVQGEDNLLSFEITRPSFSKYEDLMSAYSNYWMLQPKNDVFNADEWSLNDFSVEYEVHIEGETDTIIKSMSYSSESYSWNGKISFDNIKIPYDKVEVEYYNGDNGGFVEPYLLHYDLYLKKSNDKMILSIPKLSPREDYENLTGDEKILNVNNINIKEANPIVKTLYLNGQSGDDSLDGTTVEKAVKTFEKAKEIASINQNIKDIIVIGTTDIQGDISLEGTNAKILRGESFNGYLFRVSSDNIASLSNIVVDGNYENNNQIENSLIEVKSKATLNIKQGTTLKNNRIKAINNTPTNGGAIFADSSTINMEGGIIENNQATYGGGIHLNGSVMNFSGGTIQNNKSDLVIDRSTSPTQYYSAGGGIIANGGSTINMSADAKVLNNYAKEIGGGISLGTNQWGATNILKMTGGIVDGNAAGSAGGGIFVQAKYYTGGASKAYIDSGKITNNQMDASGYTDKMFGGGGIYVNGANNNYNVDGANGELYLKNVVITDNESKYEGAGYASCPISVTKIYVTNGGAIYGNKTTSNVNEIYILSNRFLGLHGGNPEYNISERMLGGVPYNWKNKDNSLLDKSKYKGVLTRYNEYIGIHTDEKANELTASLEKVLISGNRSGTRGGGIGSNGTVTIGSEETTNVSVEKKWINENINEKNPEFVTVKLVANIENNKYEIESRQLSEDNSWKTIFENLPTKANDKDIIYSIEEVAVEGYTSNISGNAEDGFIVTNTRSPKTSIQVTKNWEDNNNQEGKRPTSVVIKLLADGKEISGKILTLSKENNWKGTFTDLDEYKDGKKIEYTVKEENVGFGYISVISGNLEDGFIVTNTRSPKTSIQVTKNWEDNNNQEGKRPTSVVIKLLADGKEISGKILTLSKENNWKGTFTDLDEYKDGKKIEYTVKEENVGFGYISVISGNKENGYIVTNIKKPNIPPKITNYESPKTSNNSNIFIYFICIMSSLMGIIKIKKY